MFETHPQFKAPANVQIPIWRYMDLPKFISLLDEQSLYFTRSDKFADPFEGSLPRPTVEARNQLYEVLELSPELEARWAEQFSVERRRRYVAVNCWHMNEQESAAMWNQYGLSGVAVQSTYERLRDSFVDEQPVFIGTVEYCDYSKKLIDADGESTPFLYKRKSFEHERELRACIWKPPVGEDSKVDWTKITIEHGCHIAVHLPQLIETVFVAPAAPPWFVRAVKSTVQKFGFDFNVLHSGLDDSPVF